MKQQRTHKKNNSHLTKIAFWNKSRIKKKISIFVMRCLWDRMSYSRYGLLFFEQTKRNIHREEERERTESGRRAGEQRQENKCQLKTFNKENWMETCCTHLRCDGLLLMLKVIYGINCPYFFPFFYTFLFFFFVLKFYFRFSLVKVWFL